MTANQPKENLSFLIVALNYFPLLYFITPIVYIMITPTSAVGIVTAIFLWLYVLPPVICRILLASSGLPEGRVNTNSRAFTKWWFLSQLQMVFNRFPFLEELLRIVPALYSSWLFLWGSKVSPFVLWSPGVRITDRYLIHVEAQAVIGWGAHMAPHLFTRNEEGESQLILGKIRVGRDAIVGGKAVLGPGSQIHAGEAFPATRILGPFHIFQNGRRVPPSERFDDH